MINKLMKGFKKNNKGFTLVELMVVVIIGILVAIAIPVYNASTARAEAGACEANRRMIESAIEQYKMNNPDDLTDGDLPADFNLAEKILSTGAGYFKSEPKCPLFKEDVAEDVYGIDTATGKVTCPKHPDPVTDPEA
jgi:prepilin-type N-terminal cleavage/methylation domain-containing protein